MDLGISGRKALVNGGSAGLGRGTALALAREKTELFITARGEERLMAVCEELVRETGANITPIVADHSSDEGTVGTAARGAGQLHGGRGQAGCET